MAEVKAVLKRRRMKIKPLIISIIILLFILSITLLGVLEFALKPTIISLAEAQADWKATETIYSAILEQVSAKVNYTDMVKIEKNSQGEIVFMYANILLINKIASEAVLEVQKSLKDLQTEELAIPLGQILGSKLLATYGPKMDLKLIPVGTVRVNVKEDFSDAGINQTRHKIYLEVISDIKVVVPFISSTTQVKTDVPLADTIIVGPVPEHYWGGITLDIGAEAPVSSNNKI
ncbi:MAG: hypothetical protein PWQ96_1459 [Clostridia bacterium]|nr:hypothetical protein [Clostridia bacterium]